MSQAEQAVSVTLPRVQQALVEAIQGYKAAHPDATHETLQTFGEMVRLRMERHTASDQSREQRKLRRAQLNELAKENGVQFTIEREHVQTKFSRQYVIQQLKKAERYLNLADRILDELDEGLEICAEGGTVLASFIQNIDGVPYVTIGASYCSRHDTFDKLAGKEIALDRVLNGPNVKEPLRLGFTNNTKARIRSLLQERHFNSVNYHNGNVTLELSAPEVEPVVIDLAAEVGLGAVEIIKTEQ
jgi:hypothetical protein